MAKILSRGKLLSLDAVNGSPSLFDLPALGFQFSPVKFLPLLFTNAISADAKENAYRSHGNGERRTAITDKGKRNPDDGNDAADHAKIYQRLPANEKHDAKRQNLPIGIACTIRYAFAVKDEKDKEQEDEKGADIAMFL